MDQLGGGFQYSNVSRIADFYRPPDGSYYIYLFLEEWGDDNYEVVDRFDFQDKWSFPENTAEPLIGGIPVDGFPGWFLSEWFGYYSTAMAPWLYHGEHGFIYRFPGSSIASMFIYDDAMGAWWTNETIYPFIYVFNPPADNAGTDVESEWLFYFEGSSDPRSFGVVTGPSAGSFLFFNP
jgi:hypothetical protein